MLELVAASEHKTGKESLENDSRIGFPLEKDHDHDGLEKESKHLLFGVGDDIDEHSCRLVVS